VDIEAHCPSPQNHGTRLKEAENTVDCDETSADWSRLSRIDLWRCVVLAFIEHSCATAGWTGGRDVYVDGGRAAAGCRWAAHWPGVSAVSSRWSSLHALMGELNARLSALLMCRRFVPACWVQLADEGQSSSTTTMSNSLLYALLTPTAVLQARYT